MQVTPHHICPTIISIYRNELGGKEGVLPSCGYDGQVAPQLPAGGLGLLPGLQGSGSLSINALVLKKMGTINYQRSNARGKKLGNMFKWNTVS